MKFRILSRFKGQLASLLFACALLSVPVGCGSSSEEGTEQEVGIDASKTEGENAADEPLNTADEAGGNVAENEFLNEASTEENFNNFESNAATNDPNAATNDPNALGNANAGADESFNNFENNSAAGDASLNGENTGGEDAALIGNGANDSFDSSASNDAFAANAGEDPFAAKEGTTSDINGNTVDPFVANSPTSDPFAAAPEAADPAVASQQTAESPVSAPSVRSAELPSQGMVPEDGARMAYYIQVGDSLATIAQKIYGNSGSWKALAQENNISEPNLIYAGDVLYYTLNGKTRSFAQSYESSGRQSVTVQSGDTLSGISQRVFGTQAAWRTLWKENPQVTNPDVISSGMVLTYRSVSGNAQLNIPDLVEEMLAADFGE